MNDNNYSFNIPGDARERANKAKREPERLRVMRSSWESWNATMPEIAQDAMVHPGYSSRDMPQR